MMKKFSRYLLIFTAPTLLLACAEPPVQAQGSTPEQPAMQSSEKILPATEEFTITGMLTLKGSEPNLWLAVSDASGKVWRLESNDQHRLVQLREWQNRRVKVQGSKLAPFLSIDRLQISNIHLE